MRNFNPLKLKIIQSQDGIAIIQVLMVSAFLLTAGFFLMQSLSNADRRSQNMITKSNWISVSEYLQQQAGDTDGLIRSSNAVNPNAGVVTYEFTP